MGGIHTGFTINHDSSSPYTLYTRGSGRHSVWVSHPGHTMGKHQCHHPAGMFPIHATHTTPASQAAQTPAPPRLQSAIICTARSRAEPLLIYQYIVAEVLQLSDCMTGRKLQSGIEMLKTLALVPMPDERRVFRRLAGCVSLVLPQSIAPV
jgi:hypothetical protein